jgi:excisionase family DNA binding protein
MTVAQAALALEVARGTVYDLCRLGLLAHTRVGARRGVIRISETDLQAYRAGRRVETREPEPPAKTVKRAYARQAAPDEFDLYRAQKEERRAAREARRASKC